MILRALVGTGLFVSLIHDAAAFTLQSPFELSRRSERGSSVRLSAETGMESDSSSSRLPSRKETLMNVVKAAIAGSTLASFSSSASAVGFPSSFFAPPRAEVLKENPKADPILYDPPNPDPDNPLSFRRAKNLDSIKLFETEVLPQVSLDEFVRAAEIGDVKKVIFLGLAGRKALVYFIDGKKALIGKGYPVRTKGFNATPSQILSFCINKRVPHDFAYDLGWTYRAARKQLENQPLAVATKADMNVERNKLIQQIQARKDRDASLREKVQEDIEAYLDDETILSRLEDASR
uniref:Uncharacterized protein n=1 Tax=Chromera velia CCMP2878 TaxID=1169474 RepID=A0A0G4GKN8_9ALVE|mmetsp:Transcript_55669/g.108988  ORF Transcript_55669/g.108988 Transcript_55669/m.108988 type:complete len:292 (-) Transcript_55669:161-1036(-)|eukprot:Cvel_22339.t1-p1 / transcript=Cvel_22339.t1 / gene=Cvel_22339 / organism=Chromera_velia_CCMP2878 / gene_product=hypothetical protein / transcript_product=hypothetical protein / location=Cvel_scaffold2186:16229-21617(+) / protein_length=291 / sequence_SO=supercontig / SO=protein_coding / is_pseudo=false